MLSRLHCSSHAKYHPDIYQCVLNDSNTYRIINGIFLTATFCLKHVLIFVLQVVDQLATSRDQLIIVSAAMYSILH